MRVGLSSYTFPWAIGLPGSLPEQPLTAVGLIRKAAAAGVPVVQFADNLALHTASDDQLAQLERVSKESGVSIELGARGIGDHLDSYVSLARRFGTDFVRVVIDRGDDHPTPQDAQRRLATHRRIFEAHHLRLAIENHDRYTSAQLAHLVTSLGDWVGICLDTVNSFGALESPETVVEILGPLAINLHLKDFTIRRPDHAMGFLVEGAPAGSGKLDIPWLLGQLAAGATASAVLELWTPPEPTIAATVAKEQRWAEESLRYLRDETELEFV